MLKINEFSTGRKSLRYPEYSVSNIIVEMVGWVLKKEVERSPHAAWISVEQLIWGKGMHWKEDDCPEFLKIGLRKHLKIHKATKTDRFRHFKRCGWELPELPPDLYISIKSVVEDQIINSIIREKKYGGINFFWVRGQNISNRNPPTMNLKMTGGVVGWFFHLIDPEAFESIQDWLNSLKGKNEAIKYLWHYSSTKCEEFVREQIASATKKLELFEEFERNKFDGYNQIEIDVNPGSITWNKN